MNEQQEKELTHPRIYAAMNEAMASLSKTGIGKNSGGEKGSGINYKFRGIDDLLNEMSPILTKNKILLQPKVLKKETDKTLEDRFDKMGKPIVRVQFMVSLMVKYTFIHAEDGSKFSVVVCGEAMDYGDKATSKAMSMALKYAFIQAFCIPIVGDEDGDMHQYNDERDEPFSTRPQGYSQKNEKRQKEKGPARENTPRDGARREKENTPATVEARAPNQQELMTSNNQSVVLMTMRYLQSLADQGHEAFYQYVEAHKTYPLISFMLSQKPRLDDLKRRIDKAEAEKGAQS